jgi:hypothetical protein
VVAEEEDDNIKPTLPSTTKVAEKAVAEKAVAVQETYAEDSDEELPKTFPLPAAEEKEKVQETESVVSEPAKSEEEVATKVVVKKMVQKKLQVAAPPPVPVSVVDVAPAVDIVPVAVKKTVVRKK